MNLVANEIHLVVVELWLYSYKLPGNIHALFVYLWQYSCILTQVISCLIGTLGTMVQVGGGRAKVLHM